MIIDCISDLHGYFPELEGGDLLIVAGDLTATGTFPEYCKVFKQIANAKYKKKVLIAGNHDNLLQTDDWFAKMTIDFTYLCDSGTEFSYHIDGFPEEDEGFLPSGKRTLKIWGSPWTKNFKGQNPKCKAFGLDTEEELAAKFSLTPDNTDILITHSPPLTKLDQVKDLSTGKIRCCGSIHLAATIGCVNPKLHVFGHIHEGYGIQMPKKGYKPGFVDTTQTISVNASIVNERYEHVNKPIRVIL